MINSDKSELNICEHREWIGQPAGCVPLAWRCVDCGVVMTAGEMVIYAKLANRIVFKEEPT